MSMMNKVISFDKVDMQQHLFISGTPTIPEVNFLQWLHNKTACL